MAITAASFYSAAAKIAEWEPSPQIPSELPIAAPVAAALLGEAAFYILCKLRHLQSGACTGVRRHAQASDESVQFCRLTIHVQILWQESI